jgi:gluconate 2-dehydrogenase alpha chain
MTDVRPETDVVVVGLGAAGGIAAHVLTDAGLEVVGLEAGSRLSFDGMRFDELRNDIRNWMSDAKAKLEVPTWRESPDAEAGRSPWPMLMANAVGGSTVHYECMSLRFHPWNFKTRSKTIARYGPGAIPAGSTVADWPVGYDELEPFYDRVERAIGVAGHAGRVRGEVDPDGNHFEADRSRGYPMKALRRSGWASLMADAARHLGWHPFPSPAAINTELYNGNSVCTYCGFCQSNGCYTDAKGSTAATVIPLAEATGRLRIEPSARAVALDVDPTGRVSGVRYVQDGRESVQPARAVLVAGFTYENSRLLLLSTSAAYPNGLSNNHGQVGRDFIAHVTPFAFAVFPGKRLNIFNGTVAQATCLDDWNADNFDHAGLDFIGGGMFASMGEFKPIAAAGGPAVSPRVPRWGSEWKSWIREHAQSVGGAVSQFDALSYETNYLDLDPLKRDALGLPVVRVTHRLHENEVRGSRYMAEQLQSWLLEAGAAEAWSSDGQLVEGRHVYGGTRMGPDPHTSVVDSNGFSHEVPNLGIIGASTFPTAGGHNPTLTVQALTWRTAEHLIGQWSAITGR